MTTPTSNRFLSQTLGVLQEILATRHEHHAHHPRPPAAQQARHERILSAILDGDAAAARRAAKRHVTAARDAALLRLAGEKQEPA